MISIPYLVGSIILVYYQWVNPNLIEDQWVEFKHANTCGSTFVCHIDNQFTEKRSLWREGALNYKAKKVTFEDIDDAIISESGELDDIERPISMSSFIPYLRTYWPEFDPEFPTDDRIELMNLEELVEGEWRFVDKNTKVHV